MAVLLFSDQAASARLAHVILGLVVTPVLIDAEDASKNRSLAFEVFLAVAIDVDRRALDQCLVRILSRGADMRADGPRLVLAKRDTGRAIRIHGIHHVRFPRRRRRDPWLNQPFAIWSNRENDPEVLERGGRLRIKVSIRVDALDINDVLAVGVAADEITLLLHGSDDAIDPLPRRADLGQKLMRAQQGGGNVLGEALGRGEAVQLAELGDRPSRRRTHETVRRRVEIAKVRKDLLRFENEVRPLACERIECDRMSLELA